MNLKSFASFAAMAIALCILTAVIYTSFDQAIDKGEFEVRGGIAGKLFVKWVIWISLIVGGTAILLSNTSNGNGEVNNHPVTDTSNDHLVADTNDGETNVHPL